MQTSASMEIGPKIPVLSQKERIKLWGSRTTHSSGTNFFCVCFETYSRNASWYAGSKVPSPVPKTGWLAINCKEIAHICCRAIKDEESALIKCWIFPLPTWNKTATVIRSSISPNKSFFFVSRQKLKLRRPMLKFHRATVSLTIKNQKQAPI